MGLIKGTYIIKIINKDNSDFGKILKVRCDGTNSYPWQDMESKKIYTNKDIQILESLNKIVEKKKELFCYHVKGI